MSYREARGKPARLLALVVVSAALLGVAGCQSLVAPTSPETPHLSAAPAPPSRLPEGLRGDRHGATGEADGVVPDGVTVFADEYPAVANLDPALLRALRQAATE